MTQSLRFDKGQRVRAMGPWSNGLQPVGGVRRSFSLNSAELDEINVIMNWLTFSRGFAVTLRMLFEKRKDR